MSNSVFFNGFLKSEEHFAEYLKNYLKFTEISIKDFLFKVFLLVSSIFLISGSILVAIGFIAYGLALILEGLGVSFPGLNYLLVGSVLLGIFILILWKKSSSSAASKEINKIQQKIKQSREHLKKDLEMQLENVKNTFSPNFWIQKYPWASTGGALVFGFVIAGTGMVSTQGLSHQLQGKFNSVLSSLILMGGDFFKTLFSEQISLVSSEKVKS